MYGQDSRSGGQREGGNAPEITPLPVTKSAICCTLDPAASPLMRSLLHPYMALQNVDAIEQIVFDTRLAAAQQHEQSRLPFAAHAVVVPVEWTVPPAHPTITPKLPNCVIVSNQAH